MGKKHLVSISVTTTTSFLILSKVHSKLSTIDFIALQIPPCTQSRLLIPKLTETIAFWLASFPVQYQSDNQKKKKWKLDRVEFATSSMAMTSCRALESKED
jgi:hypothetical protein